MTSSLWEISIITTLEAEDAVSAWFEGIFGEPASAYTDAETGATTISICLPKKPLWTPQRRTELAAGLKQIRACGLDIGPGRFTVRRLARRNWVDSWKRHFQPLEFGAALLLKPGWSRRRPRPGQAVVVLDPGLSFGTGRHPTTAFCLRQLVARRRPETEQSFLDVGTGSGILAIAAAKLGYEPIAAFDFDPEAVRVARANARRNRVSARIDFFQQDVTRLSRRPAMKYSLVCANLIGNLLVAERDRLLAQLEPQGTIVLAGILKTEFAGVRQAFEAAGLRLAASRVEQEWQSGAFSGA